jgi:ABC-2 type transport system ATP-binding protein
MSLIVQNLSKHYGPQKAVDDISFTVEKGGIVGFLGPNGAGKSTTMKIATAYLAPSSGTVEVNGIDVQTNPLEAKKIIGYLPEQNPMYLDLYVHEYLEFVAGIYGIDRKRRKSRIAEMIELCGLTREQNKKIESLSKGYRQRVGLAQALIHDPSVLILDEPTTGLDPNQILEIRNVIREISSNKTVIFSTHILQEVQALCDRVIVINKGKIVANDSLKNLMSRKSTSMLLVVDFEKEIDVAVLASLPGVLEVVKEDVKNAPMHRYRIVVRTGSDVRAEIFRLAADRNLSLVGLKQEEESLENIFRELTL